MLLRKQSWQTSVQQKLKDREQAVTAKRQNSWTALPVWKYNSSKINTVVIRLQKELPDENANSKCSLNLKHAKKPTPASTTQKYTRRYTSKKEQIYKNEQIYRNNQDNHFWDNT